MQINKQETEKTRSWQKSKKRKDRKKSVILKKYQYEEK